MKHQRESVCLRSLGDSLAGTLFRPDSPGRAPVLIVCHGAGEFKENYFELAEVLVARGIAVLALDMHGHGGSGGERFHVRMSQWVPDIRAAVDFLQAHPGIDGARIGAFGLSSGGTAILEAALVEPRLKSLVALDATVRNSLPLSAALMLKLFILLGRIKRCFSKNDLRVPLAKLSQLHLAEDPEVQARIMADPRVVEVGLNYPFPGATEAFFVDTITRLPGIKIPTLVVWGEGDKVDPVETGRLLHAALGGPKDLQIIPGNGHMGHMDRNRARVFELTGDWLLKTLS